MKIVESFLDEVFVFSLDRYSDDRGFFVETYQSERYIEFGINENFVQDNQSRSSKNVLRGLHFTINNEQSQLMTVLRGEVFDVVVDVRPTSLTFGHWRGFNLSDSGPQQIYMPHGFAHGFCVLSDFADLHYKVSKNYNHQDEAGIIWSDPLINIEWPIKNPIISDRDNQHKCLNEFFS